MSGVNGYFQLQMNENGTYVRLFPPKPGGAEIRVDEVKEYLISKGYTPDIVAISKSLDALTEPTDIKISDKKGHAESETFKLIISEDKMQAIARFYPPSNLGKSIGKEEIISTLKYNQVVFGIQNSIIDAYVKSRTYCTDIIVAVGVVPVQGTDASIEYFFNTNPNSRPTLNADGTVDFFNLNLISKCAEGQILAELTKEVSGSEGTNVLGEVVAPREVKRLSLKYGRNITLSEDECTLTSDVSGHVSLVDDKVFVSNIYEVNDVDTSTGNIEYDGDVVVLGNVRSGFCVSATGSVEVRGVVEAALIDASKDIIIIRGMNGMGKGRLKSGGNIVAKFFENANVSAEGYVHSEAILHSNVSAKGDIEVTGKKGFIIGGSIKTLGCVSAKYIGSSMGGDTEIEVGSDPGIKLRYDNLQKSIADAKKKVTQMEPILVTFAARMKKGDKLTQDQIMTFKQMSAQYKELKEQIEKDMNDFDSLAESLEAVPSDSYVKVSDIAYPGTKITISEVSTILSKPAQHSKFVREGADVRIKGF